MLKICKWLLTKNLKDLKEQEDILTHWMSDWWSMIDAALVAIVDTEEPTTIEETLSDVNSTLWPEAIQSEHDSQKQNQNRDLVDLPAGKNIVGWKWIFKRKQDADGQIQRCRVCLAAQGYSKISAVDYDEVFPLWQSIAQFVLC